MRAKAWFEDPKLYGVDWEPLAPCQVPYARFETSQIQDMLNAGWWRP